MSFVFITSPRAGANTLRKTEAGKIQGVLCELSGGRGWGIRRALNLADGDSGRQLSQLPARHYPTWV
jgi:hypothetical protein